MDNLPQKFAGVFPLRVVLCSALALWHPPLFTRFSGLWIRLGLGGFGRRCTERNLGIDA